MTIRELQKQYLPIAAPEDFFVLLAHATEKEKAFLLAHPEYILSKKEEKNIRDFLERRLKREPVAYITGHKEFYGREFRVTQKTLIPRPETELLIESALTFIASWHSASQTDLSPVPKNIDIIDIGTGSGNIIITLVKEIEKMSFASDIRYSALDISPGALAIAIKNATYHGVAKKILFFESDLLQHVSFTHTNNHQLIITANLPYLSESLYQRSAGDIRDYEPKSALESGHDGLDHYRRLLSELKSLSPSSAVTLFLEISPEQTLPLTEEILTAFPQATLLILRDLSDRNRLIQASLPENTKTP